MIDLIITPATFGPAELFTRNFRVHSGIPIGLYREGPRAPVALVYGDVSEVVLEGLAEYYQGLVAIPWTADDAIPESPAHYETMTVKAPILATLQGIEREGFAPFVSTHEGDPFVLHGQSDGTPTLLFTADLVKATIRILSGELERTTGTDRRGRHNPAPDSVVSTPGVSLHFNLIANALRYLFKKLGLPLLSVPRWPESAPMAVFLSHDIDTVRKWTPRRTARELLRGIASAVRMNPGPLVETIQSVHKARQGRDPYWMYDEVLFMEESGGYSSTWFFAPFGGEYSRRGSPIDPVYRRSPAEITAMIRRLVERGCEVALHGTRQAFLDEGALRRQLASFEHRLGFKFKGVRHHYLMFRHDNTLEAAACAGLAYDATLGFSDRPGFRNGIAAPFFPFPSDHQAGGIAEIPLTFMDTVFTHTEDSPEQAERRVTEAYLYARAAGGLFSVLVHPENLGEAGFPALDSFYKSLISRFVMDRARGLTGTGLAEWWIAREQVLKGIETAPGAWRIRGMNVPPGMDFCVTAPNLAARRFSVTGAGGGSRIDQDTLTLSPENVDPEQGLTITMSD
jgi:hypothetical protein